MESSVKPSHEYDEKQLTGVTDSGPTDRPFGVL